MRERGGNLHRRGYGWRDALAVLCSLNIHELRELFVSVSLVCVGRLSFVMRLLLISTKA